MRSNLPFGRVTLVVLASLIAFAIVLVASSNAGVDSTTFRTGAEHVWNKFGNKQPNMTDISFDLTTPPVAGCEELVNDLQSQIITRYKEIFKGIRHANLFGYLETENKGDAAIWVAQQQLLAVLGIETMVICRYLEHCDEEKFRAKLEYYRPHSAVIMAGGGNFNDYYWGDQPARMKMIEEYANVSVRAFPQSIYMTKEDRIQQTKDAFRKNEDLQLAARDKPSYDWLQETFGEDKNIKNELVPDIALMWGNRSDLRTSRDKTTDVLILARRDAEVSDGNSTEIPWGKGELDLGGDIGIVKYHKIDWRHEPTPNIDEEHGFNQRAYMKAMDGFDLLGSARFIITDRLHGHILSTVIGTPHVLMDSKLGKNLNFHNTWTRDCQCTRITDNMAGAMDVARMYFEANPSELDPTGDEVMAGVDLEPQDN